MREDKLKSFVDKISPADRLIIDQLRKAIKAQDKAVSESPGKIMSATDALCYKEDGVMKYGLARTKAGYTFHSMVMYANSDVTEFAKTELTGVKFQKGCINIPTLDALDLDVFGQMLKLSAKKDFGPVIDHYKNNVRARSK